MSHFRHSSSVVPFAADQHLDASILMHHDDIMRTTVTLDPDVDRLLKEEMRRSGTTFRQALNQAIRRALVGSVPEERLAFQAKTETTFASPGCGPCNAATPGRRARN